MVLEGVVTDKFSSATNFWASHSCKALGEALEAASNERDEWRSRFAHKQTRFDLMVFLTGLAIGSVAVLGVMK